MTYTLMITTTTGVVLFETLELAILYCTNRQIDTSQIRGAEILLNDGFVSISPFTL